MSCTITYKGQSFTEEEFKNYVSNNISEFSQFIDAEASEQIVTPELTGNVANILQGIQVPMSDEFKQKISYKYQVAEGTPLFQEAVSRELFNDLLTQGEMFDAVSSELVKAYASMSKEEISMLSGFNRDLYNLVTNQSTEFKYYPDVNKDQIAFLTDTGWVVIKKDSLEESATNNTIDTEDPLVIGALASQIIEKEYKDSTIASVDYSKILNEREKSNLENKLTSILSRLGFSVVKMEEYKKNAALKNGVSPTVEALADMASRLIAISEGGDVDVLLSEETAHVLVETYNNQDEIRAVLPEVEKSKEWAEHSATYFKMYSDPKITNENLTEEQVLEKVRREILGKVIANRIYEGQDQSFISRVEQIVRNFFDGITRLMTGTTKSNLNSVIDTITQSVREENKLEELYSENNLENSLFTSFYSVDNNSILTSKFDELIRNAQKLINKNRGGNLKSKMDALTQHVASAEDVRQNDELRKLESLRAASKYIDIAQVIKSDVASKLNKFDEAVAAGNKPKVMLNSVEAASMNILATETLPHLQSLSALIPTIEVPAGQERLKQNLITQINSLLTEVNRLKGEIEVRNSQAVINLTEDLTQRFKYSESAKNALQNYLADQHKDFGLLQMFFGNLQNSSNIILGTLGRIISDLTHKTDSSTSMFKYKFLETLNKLGINQDNLNHYYQRIIQKDSNGKLTGYLRSVVDWGKFEEAQKANKLEAYNKGLKLFIDDHNSKPGAVQLTYEEVTDPELIGTKPNMPSVTLFRGRAKVEYNSVIDVWREQNIEYPHKDSFRKQRNNMVQEIQDKGITLPDGTIVNEIPSIVLDMMSDWASERRRLKSPYTVAGKTDYSKMSDSERIELENIKKSRLESKSLVDTTTGELKTGSELEIARALQAIEQFYINKSTVRGQRKLSPLFLDTLKNTPSNKAFEWFTQNSGITFKSDFWDTLKQNTVSSTDKFRNAIDNNISQIDPVKADHMKELVDKLEELQERKTQFLKQFRNSLNPAETDADVISPAAKEIFRVLESDIQDLYSELNNSLSSYMAEVKNPLETESTANDSFYRDYLEAKESNKSMTEADFAQKHMTRANYNAVETLRTEINFFKKNGTVKNTRLLRRILNLPESATTSEIVNKLLKTDTDQLIDDFAKTKVSSYYKRFAPKGFSDFYSEFKNGQVKDENGNPMTTTEVVEGIINGTLTHPVGKFLDIKPEADWLEDENPLDANPNYIQSTETSRHYGGYNQPKFDKYKNNEFIQEYGIDEETYLKTGHMVSSSKDSEKLKELEMINMLVQTRYDNFKKQGQEDMANAYSLPGVRKTSVEKSKRAFAEPVNSAKEWFRDNVQNSVDKKIFGETVSGELGDGSTDINSLVVPTLNVRALEDLQDTSQDLFFSYMVHTYNANLFHYRNESLAEVNQLENLLLRKGFTNKEANKSNTYKAFQDFKKAYLFGVQESTRIKFGLPGGKIVDITNLLRGFDKMLGTINVGLNPAVSITAASSALTFGTTEVLVGQYTNPMAMKKGIARFHSKAKDFLAQSGQINKTNEIYLLGERFGIFRSLSSAENSGESKFLREGMSDGISGLPHIMTEVLTKPVGPSTMYAVLDDTRLVNGELMDFFTFKKNFKGTKTETKNKWLTYESMSVLNNVSIEGSEVKYSKTFEDYLDSTVGGRESFETDLRNKISTIVSKVDAKMPMHDKSMASRNALARFLLRHRDWFTINFQNRFKSEHENLYTGQLEEGSYITLMRFINQMMGILNPKKEVKLREIFDGLTDTEKINLRRVMFDCAISAVLLAFGSLVVTPWDDDDESKDKWGVNFLAYMYYRLASEQMSSGLLGVPSYKDVLESPIVAMNAVKEVLSPNTLANPFEEVDRGAYKGHSKLFKLFAKNTFLRHYFDLTNGLEQKSDYYRLNNQWTLLFMEKTSKKEKEAQARYEEELRKSFINKSEHFLR